MFRQPTISFYWFMRNNVVYNGRSNIDLPMFVQGLPKAVAFSIPKIPKELLPLPLNY